MCYVGIFVGSDDTVGMCVGCGVTGVSICSVGINVGCGAIGVSDDTGVSICSVGISVGCGAYYDKM